MTQKEMISTVYAELKSRQLHPSGKFDNAGRFWAANDDLIDVRSPSRAYPYSQMTACRTKKYVTKVVAKFEPESIEQLRSLV